MHYLTQGWSFDPFVIVAAAVVVLHELGLARLRRRSVPRRTAARRRRSLVFYAGLVLVLLAVVSPIDYWSDSYFSVHMIQHIVIMFFAPALVVAGAPWVPLAHAPGVRVRRRLGRFAAFGPASGVLRALWRFCRSPWTALALFNAAMVAWHVPAAFDLAERTGVVHVWGMHASFFVAGVAFWLQIIPSHPVVRRASIPWQIGAVVASNVVMLVLAMALGVFTHHAWYSVYRHVPGVTRSAFADQQIGAAILWICGDFWAVPTLVWLVRRAMDEERSLSDVVEELLARVSGAGAGHGA